MKKESLLLEGEFEVLSDGGLSFQPHTPSDYSDLLNQQHKLNLTGTWEIDRNHDLVFRVDESFSPQLGRQITFKGEFLKAEAGELDFTYAVRTRNGKISLRTLRFFGKWEADSKNRLTFTLTQSQGTTNALTFNGAWKINKRHEIVYSYRKQQLKTKTKITQQLTFRGQWDFASNRSVSYVLEGDSHQAFRFRLTFATPIILAKQNEIRFQIGIEVRGESAPTVRNIILFGKWKLKHDLSLAFEVEYQGGVWHEIGFQAQYRLTPRTEIEAELFAKNQDDMGVSLTLSRSFLKEEGEAFLTLEKSLQETRLEAGASLRF